MEKIVDSTEETKELAGQLADKLRPRDVLALYGDLGTGKTTFTRFLVHALGIEARVQSPTFIVARVYKKEATNTSAKKIKRVNHIDLYRLKNPEEIADLGLKEYFDKEKSITVIEWPELAEKYLPKDTVKIKFEDLGKDKRKINVQNLH